jgi:hypothetical protein
MDEQEETSAFLTRYRAHGPNPFCLVVSSLQYGSWIRPRNGTSHSSYFTGPLHIDRAEQDLLQVFGEDCFLEKFVLLLSVDLFPAAHTIQSVLAAAFRVPSLSQISVKLRGAGDSNLRFVRALAHVLPQAHHLKQISLDGGTGLVWTDDLREALLEGFVENTSIQKLDPHALEIPFFVARLRHQMDTIVDPPVALLPHVMKQRGLRVSSTSSTLAPTNATSTFLTLQRHIAPLCSWIEQHQTDKSAKRKRQPEI